MGALNDSGPAQVAAGEPAGWRWQRLGALLRKESLQILRDPSSLAIAFVLPVMLLFLFGYGVSLDAKNVRVVAVVETPLGRAATSFLQSLANAKDFRLSLAHRRAVAEEGLREGRFDGVIVLRSDFEKRIHSSSGAPIQLLVNGVDANRARILRGYLDGIWFDWLTHYGEETGRRIAAPIALEGRLWFNPAAYSRWFLIPGVIGIIMTLIGALLTALVIAREWERGTMEALLATPVRISEILIGKLVPYFVLGMGGMVVTS
ncbi:MAG: ABC transporter permease, partial [Alphaproteobacteria bacterium]